MTTRRTIVYGIVFTLLIAAYALTGRIEKSIERRTFDAKRIFDFDAKDIRSLSIERDGESPVEALRSDDGAWRIVSPHNHIHPNGPMWDQLTTVASNITNERPIENDAERLELFELDEPKLTVRVGTSTGTLTQLEFGAIDPTRRHRYTRVGTNADVFLTPAEAFFAFNRPLLDLRERRAFPAIESGLTAIEYRRAPATDVDENVTPAINERYTLDAEGIWWIESPVRVRANQQKLRALAEELSLMRGDRYIDEPADTSQYGLDTPFASITPYAGDTAAGTLNIGWLDDENEGKIFAKTTRSPSVFSIDSHLVTLLPDGPLGFRERRLYTGEATKLNRIVYRDANNTLELAADADTGWKLTQPPADDSEQLAISFYIAVLKGIEGVSFPEDAEANIGDPRIELELYDRGVPTPRRIKIGGMVPDSDPLLFYAETDFGLVTTIGIQEFRLLQASAFRFRNKNIFAFNPGEASIVELTIDETKYAFVRRDEVWLVAEPEGHRFESQTDMTDLLKTLSGLEAAGQALPEPPPDVIGADAPVLSARIRLESGAVAGPLKVGNRKASESRERFVTIEGRGGVYYVDQTVLDDVRDTLRGVIPQ